ncbi:MAG: M28 family peptidase [Victivallales bacterium]|nr:M28 family peptidase [Victivallales bacterium]
MSKASAENIKNIVCTLTDSIGVRLAGSAQERQAADFLAKKLSEYAPKVWIEEYPVKERVAIEELLEVQINGEWKKYPCSLFSGAPGTGGDMVDAELVFFDTKTGYQQPDLSYLKGKAVVHLGCHIENEDNYRRLMEAKPAFMLFVDVRYPADKALADGLFPEYVKHYGSRVTLNVAFQDAWQWRAAGATRARVRVIAQARESTTTVVVAELPGTEAGAGTIYAGGHHDTQANTVGADDNAIGCAAVVELARILSEQPHRRTFRLCCFGAEEQLSLGSASYVRKHRAEIESEGVFMCNFDSCGSLLGWTDLTFNAMPSMEQLIRDSFHSKGIYFTETSVPTPYTDQFPFAACGVPGLWLFRPNCVAGQFYHHRVDNTPDKLDYDISAEYVDVCADFLSQLANKENLAGLSGIPEEQKAEIAKLADSVYGGF